MTHHQDVPHEPAKHSLRRHREKGESCIHFVLSHKQHLLVVGYSIHTPRMEPEHHCWQWSPSASWSSAWLCCAMSNTQRTAWSVLQRLQQPLICQKKCVHWICGTLSRSCLLLLLSLIAVQSLTRKTPFFCCTWGTSYCGGLTLAGHQVSYQSCPIPLLLSWAGQRKSNKSLLTVNLRTRRDHSPVILSWVKQTWGKFMYFIANQIRVE